MPLSLCHTFITMLSVCWGILGTIPIRTSPLLNVNPWTSRLPGCIVSLHFWQVCPHKEFKKMILISFEHL